jgi:hypothetical protein
MRPSTELQEVEREYSVAPSVKRTAKALGFFGSALAADRGRKGDYGDDVAEDMRGLGNKPDPATERVGRWGLSFPIARIDKAAKPLCRYHFGILE